MRLREGVFLNISQLSRSFADSATTDSANHQVTLFFHFFLRLFFRGDFGDIVVFLSFVIVYTPRLFSYGPITSFSQFPNVAVNFF